MGLAGFNRRRKQLSEKKISRETLPNVPRETSLQEKLLSEKQEAVPILGEKRKPGRPKKETED